MSNTIQLKRSSTASDTPTASDLAVGELAVNTADAKLFTKHTDNSIKEISSGSGGSSLSNIADVTGGVAVTGDLVVNDTATSTWTKPAKFLVGNLGSNQNAQFTFGKDESANDLVEFSFHHVSSGSSSNYQTIGFYGGTNRLAVRADGNVSIGTAYGSPVFTNPLNVTGNTLITGDLEVQGGTLDLKNAGSQSEVRLYCESSNAHYAALKAPAHSAFSGNVDLTLPATTSTLLSTTSNLNDLANVNVGSPSNGQVLKYNSSESRWDAADDATGSGGGSSTLSGLTDTDISSLSEGDILKWSGAEWKNEDFDADKVDGKHISVVSSLPSSPDSNTIYFVTS